MVSVRSFRVISQCGEGLRTASLNIALAGLLKAEHRRGQVDSDLGKRCSICKQQFNVGLSCRPIACLLKACWRRQAESMLQEDDLPMDWKSVTHPAEKVQTNT